MQRLAFAAVLALFLGAGVVAAAVFVWPSSASDALRFNLGSVEQFPPGSVTTFVMNGDEPTAPTPQVAGAQPNPPSRRSSTNPRVFHIVRLQDGELVDLSARDPHLGCTVPWQPQFRFNGTDGWFRNPCHSETYDMAGYRVFGPAPRGLDRIALELRDGNVHIDLGNVARGPASAPQGYEFRSGGAYGPLSAP